MELSSALCADGGYPDRRKENKMAKCEKCLYRKNCQFLLKSKKSIVEDCSVFKSEDQIKSEARKEFVNMVKQRMHENVSAPTSGQGYLMKKFSELLDNLVKEMEGK